MPPLNYPPWGRSTKRQPREGAPVATTVVAKRAAEDAKANQRDPKDIGTSTRAGRIGS